MTMVQEKTVVLTNKQAAEVVDILQSIKVVAVQQRNKPEAKLMTNLRRVILRGNIYNECVTFTTSMANLFGIFLAIDTYITFLRETGHSAEEPMYNEIIAAIR